MSETPYVPPGQPVPPSMSQPQQQQAGLSDAIRSTLETEPAGPHALRAEESARRIPVKSTDDIEGFIRIDSGWKVVGDAIGGETGPLLIRKSEIEVFSVTNRNELRIYLRSGRGFEVVGDAATQALVQIAQASADSSRSESASGYRSQMTQK